MERRRSEFGYDGDDDDLYAPAPGFTPSMRLTDVGVTTRANPTHLRSFSTAWTRVREPRSVTNPTEQRAPQQVMGLAKGKVGPLAATAWAAENALHGATDPEFEWCHLIADCLGGPTAADNLVAAGKHANTYMMYIEMACKGRTGLEVQIEVLLSADHVAELIKYRIRKARGTATRIEETIDSRSAGFSRADRDALTSRIKNKIDAWSPRK